MTRNCEVTGNVTYDECYSSFSNPRNIIEREGPFNTTSSSVFYNERVPSRAINGFYTMDHNFGFFTNGYGSHWWKINLKRVVTVESVIVIAPPGEPYFQYVTVRLGNDANFTNNQIVFISEEEPEKPMPFTMKLSPIYSGQYLSLETNNVTYLGIGLMQIIEVK